MNLKDLERFEEKYVINESGCWLWIGGLFNNGYSQFKLGGKPCLGHRISYQQYVGPIPEGLFVCHKCDVPPCVNPAHLFIGSNQDNSDDKVQKGRQSKGENHGRSKLTKKQVLEIRELCKATELTQTEIGKMFGVDRTQIGRVRSNKQWSHI